MNKTDYSENKYRKIDYAERFLIDKSANTSIFEYFSAFSSSDLGGENVTRTYHFTYFRVTNIMMKIY